VSEANRVILKNSYEYMQSKDLRSERHIINLLTLLISLDRFYAPLPFTSINSREQILKFLNHQYLQKHGKGKWIEREHDADGKYISSFNYYLRLLSVFFRWLLNSNSNRNKSEDLSKWETPAFLRIKTKKPLRGSPYGINDISGIRGRINNCIIGIRTTAIITLLRDLDARPHEITALRMRYTSK